jgi:DNA transformation protein and related proteins
MSKALDDLKNIGPATIRQLKEVGIGDAASLRKLGSLAAYHRLKHAFPRHVTLVMLYALEGALRDCHWNRLPPGVKEKLREAAARTTKKRGS